MLSRIVIIKLEDRRLTFIKPLSQINRKKKKTTIQGLLTTTKSTTSYTCNYLPSLDAAVLSVFSHQKKKKLRKKVPCPKHRAASFHDRQTPPSVSMLTGSERISQATPRRYWKVHSCTSENQLQILSRHC